MGKRVKHKWLTIRIDNDLEDRVNKYADAVEMSVSDLSRKAVEEYMLNHPLKTRKSDQVTSSINGLVGEEQ